MPEFADALKRLLRAPRPSSLLVHAALFRLCAHDIQRLLNLLRTDPWYELCVAKKATVLRLAHGLPGEWAVELRKFLLGELRTKDAEHLRALAAGTLQALDYLHEHLGSAVDYEEVRLPTEPATFGGCRMTFVRVPPNPIEKLIQESGTRALDRNLEHFKNDLVQTLGLRWMALDLDRHPIRTRFQKLEAVLARILIDRLEAHRDLCVALASPIQGFDYTINSRPSEARPREGVPYRFARLASEPAVAKATLDKILDACPRHGVDVLCFPELTLPPDLLEHLSDRLKYANVDSYPALVIAGTFHHELEDSRGWVNRCHVLDPYGRTILQQDKLVAFKVPASQACEMRPELLAKLGIDERGGYEDIDVGDVVTFLDSALGRMLVTICLDYCGDQLTELVLDSRPNLFWVPAMTPAMGAFHERARFLGSRLRASSFVVNSRWLLEQLGLQDGQVEAALVACYLPCRRGLRDRLGTVGDADGLRLFRMSVILGKPASPSSARGSGPHGDSP
ncbi:MAG TPA: hypothetical protein VGG06_17050 [Thermoanaerobaculia bacterium]